jgi:hypothetical protein
MDSPRPFIPATRARPPLTSHLPILTARRRRFKTPRTVFESRDDRRRPTFSGGMRSPEIAVSTPCNAGRRHGGFRTGSFARIAGWRRRRAQPCCKGRHQRRFSEPRGVGCRDAGSDCPPCLRGPLRFLSQRTLFHHLRAPSRVRLRRSAAARSFNRGGDAGVRRKLAFVTIARRPCRGRVDAGDGRHDLSFGRRPRRSAHRSDRRFDTARIDRHLHHHEHAFVRAVGMDDLRLSRSACGHPEPSGGVDLGGPRDRDLF